MSPSASAPETVHGTALETVLRTASETVHGTALALGSRAVLIRGPSGAGKSDLALRCLALPPVLDGWPRAQLVSDDQVTLVSTQDGVDVKPPPAVAGKIEVRGVGIVSVPHAAASRLALVVDLVAPHEVPRYPIEPETAVLRGLDFPLLRLAPFEASAPVKLILALAALPEGRVRP
jgi:HPr kinase/phosphorylase